VIEGKKAIEEEIKGLANFVNFVRQKEKERESESVIKSLIEKNETPHLWSLTSGWVHNIDELRFTVVTSDGEEIKCPQDLNHEDLKYGKTQHTGIGVAEFLAGLIKEGKEIKEIKVYMEDTHDQPNDYRNRYIVKNYQAPFSPVLKDTLVKVLKKIVCQQGTVAYRR